MSNARALRDRQEAAFAAADRLASFGEEGSAAILVQTRAEASYPTVAGAFYACSPVSIDGPETEGAAATFQADLSRRIFVYNLGTAIPPVGAKLVAHSCGGRWLVRFDA